MKPLREYRHVDKSTWGPGPWQSEPDKLEWRDESTGLPCIITRNPVMGHLCGYVGVAPGHPLHSKQCEETELDAHSGVNYADLCMEGVPEERGVCHVPLPGESAHVWWFGFDAGHGFDVCPAFLARNRHETWMFMDNAQYRDIAYMVSECEQLAAQLKAAA